MGQEEEGRLVEEATLLRCVAELLAGAKNVEKGLVRVASLLSRFLGADQGAFLVRRDEEWMLAGWRTDEDFSRILPRTPCLVVRAVPVAFSDDLGRASAAGENRRKPADSVAMPVRIGRRRLGFGIFRMGADRVPGRKILRLLDVVGVQVGAFCENRSVGEQVRTDRDRLASQNEELGRLLRFSMSLHANQDADAMFKWLCREFEAVSFVSGIELLSLHDGEPAVRIGATPGIKAQAARDGRAIARGWSEILSSRHRIHIPAADIRVKRFASLSPEPGRRPRLVRASRKIETPLFHAERLVGILSLQVAIRPEDDRRIDRLVESVSGQIALFLNRSADMEKIRTSANHDALTGLLNYMSFQDIFEREFERYQRYSRNMSLLLLDLDNFKGINDTFGHQVGDHVLRHVAGILKASIRKTDYAFRYGGDEFVILMSDANAERAAVLAQRIRTKVSRDIRGVSPYEFTVSTSIGIADCGSISSMEREELLLRADGALYRAKNAGRDRVQVAPERVPLETANVGAAAPRFRREPSELRVTQGAL
ncbi:MAG: GGDEF domain-containing protein [Deltaproteobacteria bacterium]|nr:GGDEF domain-containing protein [Deltaproteobacteria bacterium]